MQKLITLANKINAEHKAAQKAARSAVEHAFRCGQLLADAKAKLKHGQFTGWIEQNCQFSMRTAQGYLRLARELPNLDDVKAQRVADLSLRETLALLANPKPPVPEDEHEEIANKLLRAKELERQSAASYSEFKESFESLSTTDQKKVAEKFTKPGNRPPEYLLQLYGTSTGLNLPDDLTHSEWVELGKYLCCMANNFAFLNEHKKR